MDQLNEQVKESASVEIKIISYLMYVIGVFNIMEGGPFLFMVISGSISEYISMTGIIRGYSLFVIGLGMMIVAYGLGKMKKSSLYIATFLFIIKIFPIESIYNIFFDEFAGRSRIYTRSFMLWLLIGIPVLMYLWKNSKKFI